MSATMRSSCSSAPARSPPESGSRSSMRVLLKFVRSHPWQSLDVLVALVFAGAVEGVSLTALIPGARRDALARMAPTPTRSSARRAPRACDGRARAVRDRAELAPAARRAGRRHRRAKRALADRQATGRLHRRAGRDRPPARAVAGAALGALGVLPATAGRQARPTPSSWEADRASRAYFYGARCSRA